MRLLAFAIAVFLNFTSTDSARAAHIVGGEAYYSFVEFNADRTQVTYRIEFVIYRDSEGQGAPFDDPARFGIYEDVIGFWNNVDVVQDEPGIVDPIIPQDDPCINEPTTVGVERTSYEFEYTFDINGSDYMIAYQRCCRNNTINNLRNPGETGAAFNIVLTSEAQVLGNSSPRFQNFPPIFICQGFELSFDHSALDMDLEGDELRYSFCAPLQAGGTDRNPAGCCSCTAPNPQFCRPEFDNVIYVPPFSPQMPLGGNPVVSINPFDGLISGVPQTIGQFVVGVCVEEFRDGVLLSTVRRDFQFNVVSCPESVVSVFDLEMINNDTIVGMDDCSAFAINSCGESSITILNMSQDELNIFSYHWSFFNEDGSLLIDEEGGPEIRDLDVTFPGVGQYTGTMIINEGSVCTDTACFVVNVFPTLEADFTFEYDTCTVGAVSFNDLSISGAFDGLSDWSWEFENQEFSNEPNPIFQFPDRGIFPVSLTVTDLNDCTDIIVLDVDYRPIEPDVRIDPSKFVGCNPTEIIFENLSMPFNSETQFLWDFGDGNFSTEFSPSHIYQEPGFYTINLDMVLPYGCQYSEDFPFIRILEGPSTDFVFTPDDPTSSDSQVQFTDLSTNADSWFWDFGGAGTSTLRNPNFDFLDTGLFEIQLTSFHPITNCPNTISKIVDITPVVMLHFPNAFTPNNDAKNDVFAGNGFLDGLFDYNMTVWNRWGEKVYDGSDPRIGWNGKNDNIGADSPQGIYVYRVSYSTTRGEQEVQEGHVTLLR